MWKARSDDSDEIYHENSRKVETSHVVTTLPRAQGPYSRRTTSIKTKGLN